MDKVWTLKAPRDKDKDFLNGALFLQTKQAQKTNFTRHDKQISIKIVIIQTNERMDYGLKCHASSDLEYNQWLHLKALRQAPLPRFGWHHRLH